MQPYQLGQLAFVIGMAIIAPFLIRFLACANHAFVNYSLNKKRKRK